MCQYIFPTVSHYHTYYSVPTVPQCSNKRCLLVNIDTNIENEMIDLLSTLHTLLSQYTNTSSHDMLEMFCSVSPIAAYSNEIVPTVPKHNVVHIDDTIYTVTLNVDGPPIQGYIVEIGDEYLAI